MSDIHTPPRIGDGFLKQFYAPTAASAPSGTPAQPAGDRRPGVVAPIKQGRVGEEMPDRPAHQPGSGFPPGSPGTGVPATPPGSGR